MPRRRAAAAAPEAAAAPVDDAAFAARMAAIGGFEPAPRLAVAVSGGADSLALCHLADRWARGRGGAVVALTVDHRLRPESAAEAAAVEAQLRRRGIAHQTLVWHRARADGPAPTAGVESAARDARYRLLLGRIAALGILHLLVAHHREDQAETVLLRLARGSGPSGLAAMAAVRETAEARLVRPLLGLPRARLVATCRAAGFDPVDDPSNRDPRIARARLRRVAPLLATEGLGAARLAETARAAGQVRALLDDQVAALLARIAAPAAEGFVLIDRAGLAAAPPALGRRALGRCLAAIGGARVPVRGARLEALWRGLVGGAADPAAPGAPPPRTLGGCVIVPWRGRLLVAREPAAASARVPLVAGAWVAWDRRFELRLDGADGTLVVARLGEGGRRAWRRGAGPAAAARAGALPIPVLAALPAVWQGSGRLIAVPHLDGVLDGVGGSVRRDPGGVAVRPAPARPLAAPGFAVV